MKKFLTSRAGVLSLFGATIIVGLIAQHPIPPAIFLLIGIVVLIYSNWKLKKDNE